MMLTEDSVAAASERVLTTINPSFPAAITSYSIPLFGEGGQPGFKTPLFPGLFHAPRFVLGRVLGEARISLALYPAQNHSPANTPEKLAAGKGQGKFPYIINYDNINHRRYTK